MNETIFLVIEYKQTGYSYVRSVCSTRDKANELIDSDTALKQKRLIGGIEIEEHRIDEGIVIGRLFESDE